MPLISLTTRIAAPWERVFDLARSIDAHQTSTEHTHERAIAGITSGLIGLGQEVTWEARHLGVRQRLSVRITTMNRPEHFQDVMVKGPFKRMVHDHIFKSIADGTEMTDRFDFSSPFGLLGWFVDTAFLRDYMVRLLRQRNACLKRLAESDDWKAYLPDANVDGAVNQSAHSK